MNQHRSTHGQHPTSLPSPFQSVAGDNQICPEQPTSPAPVSTPWNRYFPPSPESVATNGSFPSPFVTAQAYPVAPGDYGVLLAFSPPHPQHSPTVQFCAAPVNNTSVETDGLVYHDGQDAHSPFGRGNAPSASARPSLNHDVPVGTSSTESRRRLPGSVQDKVCRECGKSFSRLGDLRRHYKTTKAHVDPSYPCVFCECKFLRMDALRRHQLNPSCIDRFIQLAQQELYGP